MKTEVKGKKRILLVMSFLFVMLIMLDLLAVSVSALDGSFSRTRVQRYQPNFFGVYGRQEASMYWPILADREKCEARQDFIVQIAPGGCQPAVVRSDLLEEQNVPVFCRLDALKLNPLIDVEAIDRIIPSAKEYPQEIAGIGYHPARAALRSYDKLLGSPLINNIGYLVVVLKRQEAEREMPDYIQANLTAYLRYDMANAWGVGRSEYFLPVLSDEEWQRDYKKYEFWRGKGFLRAEWIEGDRAEIGVYTDANTKVASKIIERGRTSDDIYLPGYYCLAGMQIKVRDIASPEISARLQVNEDEIEVRKESRFFDDMCYIRDIESYGGGAGTVSISCRGEKAVLSLNFADVTLKIRDEEPEKFSVGDKVAVDKLDGKNVYLAYVGELPRSIQEPEAEDERKFVVLIKTSESQEEFLRKLPSVQKRIYKFVRNHKIPVAGITGLVGRAASLIGPSHSVDVTDTYDFVYYMPTVVNPFENRGVEKLTSWFSSQFGYSGAVGRDYFAVTLVNTEEDRENVDLFGVRLEGFDFVDKDYSLEGDEGKKLEDYFLESIKGYRDIASKYPNEKRNDEETYGEMALFKAAELAAYVEKTETQRDLLRELRDRYPGTSTARDAEKTLSQMSTLNTENSDYNFERVPVYVKLLSIREPGLEDASVEVSYSIAGGIAESRPVMQDEYIDYSDKRQVKLKRLEDDYVTVDYWCKIEKDDVPREEFNKRIQEGDTFSACDFSIRIDKINLKKQAEVMVIPKNLGAESEVNFTFKIGIEKRAIQLSPEKTAEMINNLDESIEKWEGITNKIGSVVKAMKGACFATATLLTVKNLLENFEGRSVARQQIMRGDGGWMEICGEAVKTGVLKIGGIERQVNYASVDDCLRDNNADIEKAVDYMQKLIQDENTYIREKIETGDIATTSWFGEKVVNTEASAKRYLEGVLSDYKESDLNVGEGEEALVVGEVLGSLSEDPYEKGELTYEDMKSIRMNMQILQKGDAPPQLIERAKGQLHDTLLTIERRLDLLGATTGWSELFGMPVHSYSGKARGAVYSGEVWDEETAKKYGIEVSENTPIEIIEYNSDIYIVTLEKTQRNQYRPTQFYRVASKLGEDVVVDSDLKERVVENLKEEFSFFVKFDASSYRNHYKNPEVRYWETAPYKGLPAIVPIDVTRGWYAATKQTLPTFGNVKAFEESGRVTSFWLCNVGENGVEQFHQGMGDDICRMVNLQTGEPIGLFPGLSTSEARRLVEKSVSALHEAADKYRPGIQTVFLRGVGNIEVGNPATGQFGTRCQDFMSPADCHLLFNVCDPVICPTSRCNLGGNYYVDDVVQSGVIGSVVLCLPNFKEGIMIPVCLTGIHAGMQGYVSVLKAHRDCLIESLETGRHVGICDEIYSIYLCEFFWRQLAPFLNVLIPKMIELAYGQGVRGGGEYLTVMHAWQNMEKSVEYFTSYYAVNAVNAFRIRSVQEVGSELCKVFISARYPNRLDLLLEPESPTQFHGWFSETKYSEATVPATSHYKVFYHIYAGEDQGVYYSVYLKSPPGTSFYQTQPIITVDTGYIPRGEYADETRDFTAPAGYRELCVRINEKEECGFQQVSSSFALNYVREKYVSEQAKDRITTEKECISGTASWYPLLQPSIQEGVEEALMPEIYKRGIIRVCSTHDPGLNTERGRWKDVGYCDNEKVRCWLDQKSVEDVIEHKGILNETITEIDRMNVENLIERNVSDKREETQSKMVVLRERKAEFEKLLGAGVLSLLEIDNNINILVEEIEDAEERAIFNSEKVQLLLMKARVYDKATRSVFEKLKARIEVGPEISEMEELARMQEGMEQRKGRTQETPLKTDDLSMIRYFVGRRESFYFEAKERGVFTYDKAFFYYNDEEGWLVDILGFMGARGVKVNEVDSWSYIRINKEIREMAKFIMRAEVKEGEPPPTEAGVAAEEEEGTTQTTPFTIDDLDKIRSFVENHQQFYLEARERGVTTYDEAFFYYEDGSWLVDVLGAGGATGIEIEDINSWSYIRINKEIKQVANFILDIEGLGEEEVISTQEGIRYTVERDLFPYPKWRILQQGQDIGLYVTLDDLIKHDTSGIDPVIGMVWEEITVEGETRYNVIRFTKSTNVEGYMRRQSLQAYKNILEDATINWDTKTISLREQERYEKPTTQVPQPPSSPGNLGWSFNYFSQDGLVKYGEHVYYELQYIRLVLDKIEAGYKFYVSAQNADDDTGLAWKNMDCHTGIGTQIVFWKEALPDVSYCEVEKGYDPSRYSDYEVTITKIDNDKKEIDAIIRAI